MGRPPELRVAQVSIGVLLHVIIRSLGEYFRLQHPHGAALVIGKVTHTSRLRCFAAVALAVTVTPYFAGLNRISIALAAATTILRGTFSHAENSDGLHPLNQS